MGELKLSERYSYADYLGWDEADRYELIKGKPIAQAAPSTAHQRVVPRLWRELDEALSVGGCEVFIAPMDLVMAPVFLSDEKKDTVVQPDLMVVCDDEKITERGVEGTPDLVVEVTSPGSYRYDLNTKFELYRKQGIKEYWLIYPSDRAVEVYTLNDEGEYVRFCFVEKEGDIRSAMFEKLTIALGSIFI